MEPIEMKNEIEKVKNKIVVFNNDVVEIKNMAKDIYQIN